MKGLMDRDLICSPVAYTHKKYKSYLIFEILLMLMKTGFLLMGNTVKMAGGDINKLSQAGFNPPKQREDCIQSTTLPPSQHGWIRFF